MLGVEPERLLRMLQGSELVAIAKQAGEVVGYAAAIGDGELFAFLTSLEVLPSHRRRGIGRALVLRLRDRLADRYAFDLACEEELTPFYEPLGFEPGRAMLRRNYAAR